MPDLCASFSFVHNAIIMMVGITIYDMATPAFGSRRRSNVHHQVSEDPEWHNPADHFNVERSSLCPSIFLIPMGKK